MSVTLLVGLCLLAAPVLAEEMTSRSGDIYATIDVQPNGDVDVVRIVSDLPESLNPEIESWIKQQAIQMAATPETDPPNRTTAQIEYSIVEDAQGGQGLVMILRATGVSAPPVVAAPVSLEEIDIPVRVRVNADGTVAQVTALEELPEGMQQQDLEQAVRDDIENDPEIQQAASEGNLEDTEHTITVRIRAPEGG